MCRNKVHLVRGKICPKCLEIGDHECAGELPFASVYSCGYYHDAKLRSLITRIKFSGVTVIAKDLELFLSQRCGVDLEPEAVLVPMPLAEKRLRQRGFNQAEFIANTMIEAWGLNNKVNSSVLARAVHREAQSNLEHDLPTRSANIKNVFSCEKTPPEHVVLVDDVATTGATAAEAARVLISAGGKRVDLLTLAIGA